MLQLLCHLTTLSSMEANTKGRLKKMSFISIRVNSLSGNHLATTGDVPNGRKDSAIVAMGNFVLMYGGEPLVGSEPWDPNFYLLNINNRQWIRVRMEGSIPRERSGHSAVTIGGVMYIWGGQCSGHYFKEILAFNTSNCK
ncbi:hypothetical protein DM01DRAFT_1394691 [Hesseltinella vesiculosa]|uniref:Galactose oxidase n=1 Tax=Hesseltinella vesiculosa TaxID=101127 RepID=A0A1X2GA93_9FUNG|nr:hypothetical protein DM01DRAFT_1394691 [Hesseltinella vesiculosa]